MTDEADRQAVRTQVDRIEQARDRMGDTIEEIGARLNPDHLKHELTSRAKEQVQETKNAMRSRMRDMTHNVEGQAHRSRDAMMDSIRENPIPAAMVGVGLAWLFSNARDSYSHDSRSRRREWYDDTRSELYYGEETAYAVPVGADMAYTDIDVEVEGDEPGATERARQRAGEAGRAVRDRADRAKERARDASSSLAHQAEDAADRVRHTGSRLGHEAQERAGQMRYQARQRAQRAERRMEQSMRDNPLAAGAMVAALGFAAGLVVPETEREDRMMGRARDRMLDRAQETAQRTGEKVKHVAEAAAHEAQTTAKDEARQEGLMS